MTTPTDETPSRARLADAPLEVRRIDAEAEGIRRFELVHPDGDPLPPFDAGAHLHVHIDAERTRQYSLCNDPAETHRYVIAVLREPEGSGGSEAMHATLWPGERIRVSGPDNHFPIAGREARFHLLIAGGIGITPMMAMIEELERANKPYLLHYCTRSPERTAFLDRLGPRVAAGTVRLHHDGGDPAKGLDLPATLTEYTVGTHVYACGPSGLMQAVNACLGAWPPHAVHQEYFAARELSEDEKAWDATPFRVALARSGTSVEVPAGKSIVEALREHGVEIRTDCEEGYCGTCLTRLIEGEPVHRDSVLGESDREDYVMICCARSRSGTLVLDL